MVTICLVEDESCILSVLKLILEQEGFCVLAATSADEAEELLAVKALEVNLLLTDVNLPGKSGIELWKRIAPLYPSTKVLFMSGAPGNVARLAGKDRQELPFLKKTLQSGPVIDQSRRDPRGRIFRPGVICSFLL